MPDESNDSWYFQEGRHFSTESEPTALCRCGASRRKPYCDGSHEKSQLGSAAHGAAGRAARQCRSDRRRHASDDGQRKILRLLARFCHPHGDAWSLTEQSDDPEARRLAVREASMCPSGRLMAWDKETMKPYEFRFEPSLGLIEDITIGASGWFVDTRRHSHAARKRADVRNPQPRRRMPLRTVGQQALLRRHACRNQVAGRTQRRTGRRNAPPKRCTEPAATDRDFRAVTPPASETGNPAPGSGVIRQGRLRSRSSIFHDTEREDRPVRSSLRISIGQSVSNADSADFPALRESGVLSFAEKVDIIDNSLAADRTELVRFVQVVHQAVPPRAVDAPRRHTRRLRKRPRHRRTPPCRASALGSSLRHHPAPEFIPEPDERRQVGFPRFDIFSRTCRHRRSCRHIRRPAPAADGRTRGHRFFRCAWGGARR